MVRGTQGYAEQAGELSKRYEALSFEHKHQALLHLLPPAPARALDIGAGTGVNAAWLAQRGYEVVAVEPTDELRRRGLALHPSPSIEWIDDSLPRLDQVIARSHEFDLVMLTAVWMHLDDAERRLAMPRLASFLRPDGLLAITLRHGPVPEGRIMFEVSAEETIALAHGCRMRAILSVHGPSTQAVNCEAGISWSRLAFRSAA
ncbi:MAG: methyltransferase domain-containing protein [Burkholderiales bacterium]